MATLKELEEWPWWYCFSCMEVSLSDTHICPACDCARASQYSIRAALAAIEAAKVEADNEQAKREWLARKKES